MTGTDTTRPFGNRFEFSIRIAREPSPDATVGDCNFDVSKDEIIIGQLLEEVWDCEFVRLIPNFLSNGLNGPHPLF